MKKKFCPKCEKDKFINDFHNNSTKKDGLQAICKDCRKIYHKKHYEKNKKRYINQNTILRKRNSEFIKRYKVTQKCSKCSEKRWYVLDFHHVKGKDNEVSRMMNDCYSIKKIKEEIRKCIILCANCHREIHYLKKQA